MTIFINYFLTNLMAKWFNLWGEYILNHSISLNEAKAIITKSYIICLLASEKDKFDKERLKLHLSGYCIQYFDEKQLDEFYNYIMAINSARIFSRRTPSEVTKQGDKYLW